MARKAGEMTKAIRKLCVDSNFQITHAEARPLLVKLGFKVAKEPSEKSDSYKKWEAKKKGPYPKGDDARLKAFYLRFIKAAGLPVNCLDTIMEEDAVHRAFYNERNNFDVTKHNWQRAVGQALSRRPRTARAVDASKVSGTKIVKSDDILAIVKELLAVGGAKTAEKRLAEIDAERKRLSNILLKARGIRGLLPTNAA